MDEANKGVFARLDGTPAHILVIVGLALMLLAPLIINFKGASVARTGAIAEQTDELMRLDMRDFTDAQDEEKKKDDSSGMGLEDKSRREQERQKAAEAKAQELKQKYNIVNRRREFIEATGELIGTRSHYVASFLGALCLLIGLLVMTIQSDGTRQKILLIILLVVMFSALSGISLNLEGKGNLGGRGADATRSILDALPKPPPPTKP